jgi:hypothetical protein
MNLKIRSFQREKSFLQMKKILKLLDSLIKNKKLSTLQVNGEPWKLQRKSWMQTKAFLHRARSICKGCCHVKGEPLQVGTNYILGSCRCSQAAMYYFQWRKACSSWMPLGAKPSPHPQYPPHLQLLYLNYLLPLGQLFPVSKRGI